MFSCESIITDANIAVCFVQSDALSIVLAHNLPFRFLGYKLSLHGIVDGATKHESLVLFLAWRTQHPSDKKRYFKCPETSEKRMKFLAPFPINVQLHIGNLLIRHSG